MVTDLKKILKLIQTVEPNQGINMDKIEQKLYSLRSKYFHNMC